MQSTTCNMDGPSSIASPVVFDMADSLPFKSLTVVGLVQDHTAARTEVVTDPDLLLNVPG